ncbi:excisionase family DNA-binding protein [Chloroflexota bacterium]
MNEEVLAISVSEASRRLGLSRHLTYEAIRQGKIPSTRIGRRILIPLAALEKLLESGWSNNQYSDRKYP